MRDMGKESEKRIKEGFRLYAEGKFEDAELEFSRALSEDLSSADAYMGMGLIKFHLGEYDLALGYLGEALRLRPEVARLHYLVALTLLKLGRGDEGDEYYESGREIDRHDEMAVRYQALRLYSRGQYEEALKKYRDFVEDNPNQMWDVWNELGTLYYINQQYELARESFQNAITLAGQMNLSLPFVHYNLGLCYNAMSDYPAAREQFSIALEMDSQLAAAWAALGVLIAYDEDYDRAIEFVDRAIELEPENPSHWLAMAKVYELSGDKAGAQHYYSQAYQLLRELSPDLEIPDGFAKK